MPIADVKKRKTGSELIIRIYLGIRSGARHSVAEYHREKVTAPVRAEDHLCRAVNIPDHARVRINELRRAYEARNGVGTANAYITSCLVAYGLGVTLVELNASLAALEAEANDLHTMKRNGATLDSIAAWIEANWEDEVNESRFGDPAGGYVNVWR